MRYVNKTNFKISFEVSDNDFTLSPDCEIELEENEYPENIIVYNDGDCEVFISNEYNGKKDIYINN